MKLLGVEASPLLFALSLCGRRRLGSGVGVMVLVRKAVCSGRRSCGSVVILVIFAVVCGLLVVVQVRVAIVVVIGGVRGGRSGMGVVDGGLARSFLCPSLLLLAVARRSGRVGIGAHGTVGDELCGRKSAVRSGHVRHDGGGVDVSCAARTRQPKLTTRRAGSVSRGERSAVLGRAD